MTTITQELRTYRAALILDKIFPRRARRYARFFLGITEILLFLVLCGGVLYESFLLSSFSTVIIFNELRYATGVFLILFGPTCVLFQVMFFYNTLYYRGLSQVLQEDFAETEGVTLEVAEVCSESPRDLTAAFVQSRYGREVLLRLGMAQTDVASFLNSERTRLSIDAIPLKAKSFVTLRDVSQFIFKEDKIFAQFLFNNSITEKHFLGVTEWVLRTRLMHKQYTRWWGRDNLASVKGVGRELSFGVAYELQKYLRDISTTSAFSLFINDAAYAQEVVKKLEATLARKKASNAMLIGKPGVGKMDMLVELARLMREGKSVDSLIGKRIVVFDTDVFVAVNNTKDTFEQAFLTMMNQAERAGNIIIVIDQFPSFLESVSVLGVNAAELLDRYLSSPNVQIVGTSDPRSYHASVESNGALMRLFNPVIVENPNLQSVMHVLEDITWSYEHDHSVFFTYPAIMRIAETADQYIVESVMPEKAVSLMSEVASRAEQQDVQVIDRALVDAHIEAKTGIPIGEIGDTERNLLLHLEDFLHTRVVGQHDAVHAVASAMRRVRAGIQSLEKPMASFMFLGSTGVGKTETAKALAETFFGSEEHMIRFDMSEFSGPDSLARLIGSTTEQGALSTALREHPYGVLLLDEFEKASKHVHDLFLQILDEGVFTDNFGTEVSARNSIIIATSNAGSSKIYEYAQNDINPTEKKDEIIDYIISENIYKPELVNRFDGVVIFETLSSDAQTQIASLMLEDLKTRMHERGFNLVINDVLRTVLAKQGFDAEFGARPMRRAVQDIIEERIAKKIIEEGITRGDTIEFLASDFDGQI